MLDDKNNQKNSYIEKDEQSLKLHAGFPNGKIDIRITKPLKNFLHLAYSPHVAAPCMEIARDPIKSLEYTNRGNAISIVTNGSAVLGLGQIGPLASIPVMEGKSALFKMLSGIDCFVNVIDSQNAEEIAAVIDKIRLTYSAINLEDISAPSCFEICDLLADTDVPIFHDDQHGTAIVICAAISSYLDLTNKKIKDVKIIGFGAGAAAIASLNMLVSMGVEKNNIFLFDSKGLFSSKRKDFKEINNKYKADFAQDSHIELANAMQDADIFIGLSSGGKIDPLLIKNMSQKPLIMALQNPEPEVMPEEIFSVRSDAIYCSGRTDFPNQVNNVLCFPYIFRVILDFGLDINKELMISTSKAIVDLSKEDDEYSQKNLIAKPFDPIVKYLMPVYIAKRMKIDVDLSEYSRYIALKLNKLLGMLLRSCNHYIGIHQSKNQKDLAKLAGLWKLEECASALNIDTISKIYNGDKCIEILPLDILVCRNQNEVFIEVDDDIFNKVEAIQEYMSIYGISSRNHKSIIGIYRTSTKKLYIDCNADLDDIILSSLIFAKVYKDE